MGFFKKAKRKAKKAIKSQGKKLKATGKAALRGDLKGVVKNGLSVLNPAAALAKGTLGLLGAALGVTQAEQFDTPADPANQDFSAAAIEETSAIAAEEEKKRFRRRGNIVRKPIAALVSSGRSSRVLTGQ